MPLLVALLMIYACVVGSMLAGVLMIVISAALALLSLILWGVARLLERRKDDE